MLRQQGEPVESGRALDLATVTGVRLDAKVAARVLVQARQTPTQPEPRAPPPSPTRWRPATGRPLWI